jgi:hypothetical protein
MLDFETHTFLSLQSSSFVTDTVLIFKTNIQNEYEKTYVQALMNSVEGIHNCTVDTDDVDKVLRVETDDEAIDEKYVIEKINSFGFICKALE